MLVKTLKQKTGVSIHVTTMSVALKQIGRRGRPKPVVNCPGRTGQQRRLREIEQLVDNLPPSEVAVYEDEVDIHLNPKIGPDWMVPGQQSVLTPGQNEKRYLAGAHRRERGNSSGSKARKRTVSCSSGCCGS